MIWQEIAWTTSDGLTLRGRLYEPDTPPNTRLGQQSHPIVCLPGLTRNSKDFHDFAIAASKQGYRVITMDSRGRGISDYAENWQSYTILQEMQDVLAGLIAFDITRASFVGTSRGGLITMLLGTVQPDLIATAVLNDVGPKIERDGLLAIKTYLQHRKTLPSNWAEARKMVKTAGQATFPVIPDDEWDIFARASFRATDAGHLRPDYDENLLNTLNALDEETDIPELWPQFEALAHSPVLVMRGALSSLLSEDTVREMTERHPRCQTVTIPQQGHAPLLTSSGTIKPILEFIRSSEA